MGPFFTGKTGFIQLQVLKVGQFCLPQSYLFSPFSRFSILYLMWNVNGRKAEKRKVTGTDSFSTLKVIVFQLVQPKISIWWCLDLPYLEYMHNNSYLVIHEQQRIKTVMSLLFRIIIMLFFSFLSYILKLCF